MFVILISSVSAVSTDMKELYRPGETAIAKISGNFIEPLFPEDVKFKRINVEVPFNYDLKKIGQDYYLWFIAPVNENNYTLIIEDKSPTGIVDVVDFMQNFSVKGELVDYSVNPGFIFTSDDFEINVFLNLDEDLPISVDFPVERGINLRSGENTIRFSTENVVGHNFIEINVGDYVIPAIIFGGEGNIIVEEVLPNFRFSPRRIDIVVLENEVNPYPFALVNTGDEDLEIELDYNRDLFFIHEDEFIIRPDETREFDIGLLSNNQEEINEIIYARSGELVIELPVGIAFTEILADVDQGYLEGNYTETVGYYCSELLGKVCVEGEVCSGENVVALDNSNCCVGSCEEPKKEGNSLIGYILGGLALLVVAFVYYNYRKKKKMENPVLKKADNIEKEIDKN